MTSDLLHDDAGSSRPEQVSGIPAKSPSPPIKHGIGRRVFLQAVGGVAGTTALLRGTDWARAGNAWSMNLLDLPKEKLIDIYTKMLTSRWWEMGMKEQYVAGTDNLYASCNVYIGEEAIANGVMAALNADDLIASTHRGFGHMIAKGSDINKMSAEVYLKQTGYTKAFGGSMHMADPSNGVVGLNGIVGPSFLIGAGAAYSAKVRGTKQVAVAFGGDGAVNNGWYYSGLRNAALYKLPLVAVIENNGYQITVPTARTNSLANLSSFGAGLEIPYETVNGMDVLAVYTVAKRAVDRARSGAGPSVIEAKTYRYFDHSGFAGAKPGVLGAFGLPYRSDAEVRDWIALDPIPLFRRQLIFNNIFTDAEADKIETDVKAQVEKSIELARAAPKASPEDGLTNVFAGVKVKASQFLG
jgi:pyruvate dehydrogenase E1 component alpha subunit